MEIQEMNNVVLTLATTLLIFGGVFAHAISYDYTSTTNCLVDPLKPQYNGGIIVNPDMNHGLHGWTTYGDAKIESRVSKNGNKYIVAHTRKHSYATMSQKILLKSKRHYTLSAWVQVNKKSDVPIKAMFKMGEELKSAGTVIAKAGCWSMLKGGISLDISSGLAELYFESNDISIDIWVDSVSLQPFTSKEWRSHQDQSLNKVRKAQVKLQIVDPKGRPMPYANISMTQNKVGFPFGVAINQNILNNEAYKNWYVARGYTVTTFENEMKWYSTENVRGKEDYTVADNMLNFAKLHGVSVRGHNIFWEDPHYQPSWVTNLSPSDLKVATDKRLNSIVPRYLNKLIAWDVNNENLHFDFYKKKLGDNITQVFFQKTRQLDSSTELFLNDYNTIESSEDVASSPSRYLQVLNDLRKSLNNNQGSLAIGLEGHFDKVPNMAYIRSALDTLASSNLPIWITELDVSSKVPNQATYLEQILREVHAHPGVKGIVVWGAWSPQGCYKMCLTDNNFKNLPTGDVVDKLMSEWGYKHVINATTDRNGFFTTSLFHGDYQIKVDTSTHVSSSFVSRRSGFDHHVNKSKQVEVTFGVNGIEEFYVIML